MCEEKPFKSTYAADGTELPPKEIWEQMDNEFIMTYVQAYKALGFNVDVLGTDRANACGKRAVKMAEEGKLNTVKPSSYDGSVPLEKMGPMTLEEKAAYLEARTIYLETLVEAKKKWLSELLGKPVSSIRVKD